MTHFKSWITHVANYLIKALIFFWMNCFWIILVCCLLAAAIQEGEIITCFRFFHIILLLSPCDFICYFSYFWCKDSMAILCSFIFVVLRPFLHHHSRFPPCLSDMQYVSIIFSRFQQTKMRKTHSHFIYAAIIFILQSKRSGLMLDVRLFYCGKFSVCLEIIHVRTHHLSVLLFGSFCLFLSLF